MQKGELSTIEVSVKKKVNQFEDQIEDFSINQMHSHIQMSFFNIVLTAQYR